MALLEDYPSAEEQIDPDGHVSAGLAKAAVGADPAVMEDFSRRAREVLDLPPRSTEDSLDEVDPNDTLRQKAKKLRELMLDRIATIGQKNAFNMLLNANDDITFEHVLAKYTGEQGEGHLDAVFAALSGFRSDISNSARQQKSTQDKWNQLSEEQKVDLRDQDNGPEQKRDSAGKKAVNNKAVKIEKMSANAQAKAARTLEIMKVVQNGGKQLSQSEREEFRQMFEEAAAAVSETPAKNQDPTPLEEFIDAYHSTITVDVFSDQPYLFWGPAIIDFNNSRASKFDQISADIRHYQRVHSIPISSDYLKSDPSRKWPEPDSKTVIAA